VSLSNHVAVAVSHPAASCTTGSWQHQLKAACAPIGPSLAHTASTFPLVAVGMLILLAVVAAARRLGGRAVTSRN
jgi:hypothetical protein